MVLENVKYQLCYTLSLLLKHCPQILFKPCMSLLQATLRSSLSLGHVLGVAVVTPGGPKRPGPPECIAQLPGSRGAGRGQRSGTAPGKQPRRRAI